MISETARLITELGFRDMLSPGLAKARGELTAANAAAGTTGRGLLSLQNITGGVGRLTNAASNAFATLKGRIGQLAGIAGIGGLGIGLLSIGGLIGGSISQIKDFAGEVLRLKGFAKLTAEQASGLASVFEHFGIDAEAAGRLVGFAEKNLFKYAGTAKAATAFQEKYGLALRDSRGRIKDVNTLLLDAADYYVRNGNAAQRAAALAAIFGKSYLTLIPVLSKGRAGMLEVEAEARRMGLALSEKNLADFVKYREATRSWGTALAGLKVQLGADLIPLLTKLATGATAFVAQNREKIIGFINSLISYGQKAAGFIARIVSQDILPAIQGMLKFWNSLPAPIRSLLGRTVGGSLTIRFLTGIDPIGLGLGLAGAVGTKIAGAIAGGLIAKLGGFFAGIFGQAVANKAIPQVIVGTAAGVVPVFVTNEGFGGIGKFLGGAGQTAGGAGALEVGAGILGTSTLVGLLSAAAAGALVLVGGTVLLKALGGFQNRGPTATSTNVTGGLSVGPKGQIRGPSGNASDPVHVQQTEASIERQAVANEPIRAGLANVAHGYMQLAGKVPGAAITQSKPPAVLTSEQFLTKLRTTAFIGAPDYKSIFERFTTFRGGGRGTDPTGQGFLALVEQLKNPKAPQVLTEIRGHLKELQSLEAFYIAHGDTKNALKVQGVINEVRTLIGITKQDRTATHADNVRQGATLRTLHQVSSAGFRALNSETTRTANNTGITARKKTTVDVHTNVNVAVTSVVSVNAIQQQIVRLETANAARLTRLGVF